MKSVDDDDLPDIWSDVMHMQIQWHYQYIRNNDVAGVEDTVVPATYLGQGGRADRGEQSNAGDAEDHIFFLYPLGEQIAANKEIEI